jgi:malate dehydrogenase (oxaloacetate-decarboxylating)
VLANDAEHMERIAAAVHDLDGIEVVNVSDRTFLMHLGGKIEVALKAPLKTRDDLSMAYTPGVARVSAAIAADPEKVWNLTIKQHTVAVVSDGTAVLGLGDIGPEGALPVMEGKAMLFKEFGGVDAFPICLATKDPDEIVQTVKAIAPVFGGINLEDISAPRCFEIEERLREELDIPVFHDDQHGTAVVTLAALHNAAQVVGKTFDELRVVVTGVGAAGVAVTKMLLAAGVTDVVGCDSKGVVCADRRDLTPAKADYAAITNPRAVRGGADEALVGADVFIGLSRPGAVSAAAIRTMARDAIVFAMANPTPEVLPEEIEDVAAVIGTGRSDYPNQINNVLAFPGIFRGALDVRASEINEAMKLAAAEAIASIVASDELEPDYVIPSVFNRDVAPAVADEVARAADETGVARRRRSLAPV